MGNEKPNVIAFIQQKRKGVITFGLEDHEYSCLHEILFRWL